MINPQHTSLLLLLSVHSVQSQVGKNNENPLLLWLCCCCCWIQIQIQIYIRCCWVSLTQRSAWRYLTLNGQSTNKLISRPKKSKNLRGQPYLHFDFRCIITFMLMRRLGNQGLNAFLANTKNEDYNVDGKPWKLELQRPDLDLKVYSSEAAGTSFRRFKAVCVIPCAPIEFYNLVVDFKYRLTWDRNVQHITALKVQDASPGRNKITISRSATKVCGNCVESCS